MGVRYDGFPTLLSIVLGYSASVHAVDISWVVSTDPREKKHSLQSTILSLRYLHVRVFLKPDTFPCHFTEDFMSHLRLYWDIS